MTFPIKENPIWEIKDSSKLEDYYECPRKYFYAHILGWRINQPAHDLYFGECWHKAREHGLLHGYEDIPGAYNKFMECYRKEFDEESDEMYRPKDPYGVLAALMKLSEEKQGDLTENELLLTETSGTVPVDEHRVLHYRMDSVLRRKDTGKIFSWDHKSAKRFSQPWADKFFLSIQNGTYTHCLYCMYPIEEVIGVEFYGTSFEYLVRGSRDRSQGYNISFLTVPAWKTPEQMNVWLWNTVDRLDEIEEEMDRLSHCKEEDAVLMAFPMNPQSCTKYYGCAFHDFCISWPNPLQHCSEPPLGFKQEFWDPRTIKTTNKMDLEWKGE